VISVGGDLFIEDYGPPVLAMEQVEYAQMLGVPTIIWGASIWPIRERWIEDRLGAMLHACELVSVRDEPTVEYLRSLGLKDNVFLCADGAFLMEPRQPACFVGHPASTVPRRQLWAFNGSNLLSCYLPPDQREHAVNALVEFFDMAMTEHDVSLLLVPHDGPPGACEWEFLYEFQRRLRPVSRSFLLPVGLDAPETKYMIGLADLFITMRFHPSVAAMSQCVPTLGITHSPKFIGLHRLIFGHSRYTVPYADISAPVLKSAADMVLSEQEHIRSVLSARIPELQRSAMSLGDEVASRLPHPRKITTGKRAEHP
jgi:polysaccharide pyruvyl transferase WcaK-like protein